MKVSGENLVADSGSASSADGNSARTQLMASDDDEDPLLGTLASTDDLEVHAPDADAFDTDSEPIFES